MKFRKSLIRLSLSVAMLVGVYGCIATAAKWMSYAQVNPNSLNEVLTDANNNVVHVSEQQDGIHLTYYDETGQIIEDIATGVPQSSFENSFNLSAQRLLLVNSTLAGSLIVDTSAGTVTSLSSAMIPTEIANLNLTGSSRVLGDKVAVFGAADNQGWLLLLDFDTGTSALLEVGSATEVITAFGHTSLVVEARTESGRSIVSFDADLNELSRYPLPSSNLELIGESLTRPVLFDNDSHNVRITDNSGVTQWEFVNEEFEYIKGQSVGSDGRTLLWGDNSNLNPLTGVRFDKAHFLLVDTDGTLLYHHQSGPDMANILYRNTHQFSDGLVQVSFQGWTGQLSGLVLGSNLSTPFVVTRQVFHEFVTLKGNKTRWMNEPKRVETFSQCGSICVSLVNEVEGHCDNLDVFNIDSASLASVSQVCGVKDENGLALPNTVKISRF
mgnify:CR=1 FL=1